MPHCPLQLVPSLWISLWIGLGGGLLLALPDRALAQDPTSDAGVTQELFNGQDLAGWQVTNCVAAVEDGLLVIKEGNGLIRSLDRYANFVFELEWKAKKASEWDSGVYFRADDPPEGKPWPSRYQINLKQGQEGDVKGLVTATRGLARDGEWNKLHLECVGPKATLRINGELAWETEGVKGKEGYMGLQSEVALGGEFEFRNLKIQELDHRRLFNGQDLAGWEGAGADAAACWEVSDGVLSCTGAEGPWLRSLEEHDDFNLRLEYLLREGGNSGVYVHVPQGGAHRGAEFDTEQAGVEVQLLDDPAAEYQSLEPYQYSASLYAIAPATARAGRPAGEWNRLEIDCHKDRYRVFHNGVLVIDATEADSPELANRRRKGFLGLQNHSEPVSFRNIRIGPPL